MFTCTFPNNHVEIQVMSLDVDIDHFFEFIESVQHKILSITTSSSLLDRSNYAYNILKNSLWVALYLEHSPYWGTCMIHYILDE